MILDGGLATELEARGHDLSDRLWSARVLLTEPDAIADVHRAYFAAGASVATTASYQATVPGFERAGLDRATALSAIRRSVELARRARDEHAAASGAASGELLVAGSVGPYGAMLADGSEYRGDYDPGPTVLREVHATRIEALLEAGVDVLALETIPTVREAAVLVRLVEDSGARAWLSYQCRDGASTAAGEPITAGVSLAEDASWIVAVGVNCTAPRHLPALLAAVATVTTRPLVAYPNAGGRWDAVARTWVATDPSDGFDPATVASWTDLGASWLGGCCGTGPADIAGLAAALRERPEPSATAPDER
ncbi:MAG: homocysteine S-methyltransferase [Candidatus Limnocylindrales bacterium]